MKEDAAKKALDLLPDDIILGIGTGSTVNCFIDLLPTRNFKTIVSSSEQTASLLKKQNIEITELNQVPYLDYYIDGADCYNPVKQIVKGKGGALTREKILASASETFICIMDETKPNTLLNAIIPVEVIPMARSYVARELVKLNGKPALRENYITDNQNQILDVSNLNLNEPISLETKINNIPGVVENGIFAQRHADLIITGKS